MKTKSNIIDYDEIMAAKYGKEGTPEREEFRREAYTYYIGRLIYEARKREKITQSELASKVGTTKSYISKIENGVIEPGVAMFHQIVTALGLRIELVKELSTL